MKFERHVEFVLENSEVDMSGRSWCFQGGDIAIKLREGRASDITNEELVVAAGRVASLNEFQRRLYEGTETSHVLRQILEAQVE